MTKQKAMKCYYCGELIENFKDHVMKPIPMSTKVGIRNYKRNFHMECLPKYVESLEDKSLLREEDSDWQAVYEYFRGEILSLSKSQPLDQHSVKRLLGLRLGQYMPSGNNTRILPRGYDFKVILLTLKLVRAKVLYELPRNDFADSQHKTNFIMKFVQSEINDVHERVERQKRMVEKLEKDDFQQGFDYIKELERKKKQEKEKQRTTASNIAKFFKG